MDASKNDQATAPVWIDRRSSGLLLHVSSLPGRFGIGNLGSVAHSGLEFLVEAGFSHWQVCPVGPTGFGDSPYQTFSSVAGNPYFIDWESLLEADLESSETTAAVSHYLLEYQKDTDHWSHRGSRPPSSGSDFTTTYVALRSLVGFGTADQQSRIDARIRAIAPWILKEVPQDTEDHVFRLRSLPYIDAEKPFIEKAISELVNLQRSDGGWAQTSDLQSDAYATASVLLALIQVSERTLQDPVISRGVDYLLKQQTKEGSWHVVSRAKPFQTYYESGFPYGADQFISITASSWATWVLLEVLSH